MPRREPMKADRLPDVVREMVDPRERLKERTAEIRAEMERIVRRIGIMGAFRAREDIAISRSLDGLGLPPHPRLGEAVKVLEDDERCEELAKELHRLESEFDDKYSLKAFLARGVSQSLPAPEYLTLNRHEFGTYVQTDQRCRGWCSERCYQSGRHVETLHLTLYCEGDPNAHAREVERILYAKAMEIVRRNDALDRSASAFQNLLRSTVVT